MDNLSVLITGGGTGGHIFPGISLYEEFKSRKIRASMLISRKDLGFSPVAGIDKKDLFVYRAPSFTRNIFRMPFFIVRFVTAVFRAMMIVRGLRADAVIGMGGYVSAPALFAAVMLRIPVFLCEQNSVPGKVTLLFAGKARNIFTTLLVTTDYLKEAYRGKVVHAGNPIRKDVLVKCSREEAKKFFHLGHCRKVILVIGGSQGALQINEIFAGIRKIYSNELKGVGIIWTTGNYSYDRIRAESGVLGDGSLYLSPFIDEVGLAYRASDLAISRSGAGGIMEFAAAGLPSVLIPFPSAADNHQEKNAEVFEKAGASVRINREETDPDNIGDLIVGLLNNTNRLQRMAESAKSLAKINAAKDIVDHVTKELNI